MRNTETKEGKHQEENPATSEPGSKIDLSAAFGKHLQR